jgi:hypothetical protein
MRRPFLPSKDALSLRSSFLRERDLSPSRLPASLVNRIIAVAVALCLFAGAIFAMKIIGHDTQRERCAARSALLKIRKEGSSTQIPVGNVPARTCDAKRVLRERNHRPAVVAGKPALLCTEYPTQCTALVNGYIRIGALRCSARKTTCDFQTFGVVSLDETISARFR